jgi:quinol monooxygenase YgiN
MRSALGARLYELGQPDGAIHHSAGFDDNGVFRMYEVWESREHRERFVKETLEQILAEGPVDSTRTNPHDREYGYELHALV